MSKGFGKSPSSERVPRSEADRIDIDSMVALRNGEPYVRIQWGKNKTQMTVKEAMDHAAGIMQVAAAAMIDSQLVEWAKNRIGSSPEQAGQLLQHYRSKRLSTNLPSLTLNIDGEPMRPDAIRESAMQMIEMTFGGEAEAYLTVFLLEELGLEPNQVDQVIQEFREMRGATTLWATEEDDRND